MILRFILQLKSSNLDHLNSSYCILHPYYSNLQDGIRLFLHIAPLGHISRHFGVTISIHFLQVNYSPTLEVYFTHNFESLNLDEWNSTYGQNTITTPKTEHTSELPNSHLSPYSGALEIQFAPGPFYTFVSLSLMVLYQFESLHLDDYNLIYSQNKNRGFDKILTAFPLKTQHFSLFTNILPNQSQPTIQNNLKLN